MNIEVLQPKPFDFVGSTIMIAGNAVGFEGHLSISISEVHVEFSGAASAGAIALQQFPPSVDISDNPNFQLDRLFVTLTDDSAGAKAHFLLSTFLFSTHHAFCQGMLVIGTTLSRRVTRWVRFQRLTMAIRVKFL